MTESESLQAGASPTVGVAAAPPRINKFLETVAKVEASDLHLKADAVPRVRKGGELKMTTSPPLTNADMEILVREILSADQWESFIKHGAIDMAYALSRSERFRMNIFRQRGQISLAARRINPKIPNYAQLNLPPILSRVAEHEQGLVLLAGITGSGKSTTIAAMMEQINATRACHIVTVEDPIEFLYIDKKAYINQREIGLDVESYEVAIRSLMREDPDVILVGEMRDRLTFQAGIQAAETGHLVFSTIHASSASGAITRILELFPTEMHINIRQALAANLKAIIFQKLVPALTSEHARVPVLEVLLSSPSSRKYILEGRENELIGVIRGEKGSGMIDFNDMLQDLVNSETVSPKEAYAASPNPDELKMRLKGIKTA